MRKRKGSLQPMFWYSGEVSDGCPHALGWHAQIESTQFLDVPRTLPLNLASIVGSNSASERVLVTVGMVFYHFFFCRFDCAFLRLSNRCWLRANNLLHAFSLSHPRRWKKWSAVDLFWFRSAVLHLKRLGIHFFHMWINASMNLLLIFIFLRGRFAQRICTLQYFIGYET